MVEYNREIPPAIGEAQVRDVADPELILPSHVFAPDPIRMLTEARANAGFGPIAPDGFRSQPRRAHQASHTPTAARHAGRHQLIVDPRTAVTLAMASEPANNLGDQRSVLDVVRAGLAPTPRVEPRAGDVVAATERSDGEAFVVRDEMVDEGEPFAFRALQNRMAFFRRSCSSFNSAYFRSSACS